MMGRKVSKRKLVVNMLFRLFLDMKIRVQFRCYAILRATGNKALTSGHVTAIIIPISYDVQLDISDNSLFQNTTKGPTFNQFYDSASFSCKASEGIFSMPRRNPLHALQKC